MPGLEKAGMKGRKAGNSNSNSNASKKQPGGATNKPKFGTRRPKLSETMKRSWTVKSSQSTSTTATSSSQNEKLYELDGPIQKKYSVGSRLGKGAYGVVWNAEETRTGNKVALKKIYDAFRNNTDAQRTYREIVFLREFGDHPNIISLLNVHRASNNLDIYLVFPLMATDLHKLIRKASHFLTEERIRYILYQILKAVKYLHSGDVMHRDLKPANILLAEDFTVRLGDFGLARSTGTIEVDGKEVDPPMTDYVATRWYRPPEILLNCSSYSKGVDMWSIGCILAEMILKKALFPGNNTMEQVQLIMGTIDEPPWEDVEDLITPETTAMVESAMVYRKRSITDIFGMEDFDLIDLLERILVFHPDKRYTVEDVLGHRYLQPYHDPFEEDTTLGPITAPLSDSVQLDLKDYRKVIYDLISVKNRRNAGNPVPPSPAINSRSNTLERKKEPSIVKQKVQSIPSHILPPIERKPIGRAIGLGIDPSAPKVKLSGLGNGDTPGSKRKSIGPTVSKVKPTSPIGNGTTMPKVKSTGLGHGDPTIPKVKNGMAKPIGLGDEEPPVQNINMRPFGPALKGKATEKKAYTVPPAAEVKSRIKVPHRAPTLLKNNVNPTKAQTNLLTNINSKAHIPFPWEVAVNPVPRARLGSAINFEENDLESDQDFPRRQFLKTAVSEGYSKPEVNENRDLEQRTNEASTSRLKELLKIGEIREVIHTVESSPVLRGAARASTSAPWLSSDYEESVGFGARQRDPSKLFSSAPGGRDVWAQTRTPDHTNGGHGGGEDIYNIGIPTAQNSFGPTHKKSFWTSQIPRPPLKRVPGIELEQPTRRFTTSTYFPTPPAGGDYYRGTRPQSRNGILPPPPTPINKTNPLTLLHQHAQPTIKNNISSSYENRFGRRAFQSVPQNHGHGQATIGAAELNELRNTFSNSSLGRYN